MRVLHLPTNTGNQAYNLSRAERQLGLTSDVLVDTDTFLQYPADISLHLETLPSARHRALTSFRAFMKHRKRYDIFHFNAGKSLLNFPSKNLCLLDLPYYRRQAKLFVTYNGCNARLRYPKLKASSMELGDTTDTFIDDYHHEHFDYRRKAINKMQRHVEHIWAINPDLLNFLPSDKSSFLPYAVKNPSPNVNLTKIKKRIKIIHAPTNRPIKGSYYILEALQKLEKHYPNSIEVMLVENTPHTEALELYASADLIIDQIMLGWYGGFATEVMYMGKPVIAYINEDDLHFIPEQMRNDLNETIINANHETIYNAIAEIIENPSILTAKAEAGIEYAKTWHDPMKIAKITKEKYDACY